MSVPIASPISPDGSSSWMVSVPPTARVVTATELRFHCRLDYPAPGLAGQDDDFLYTFIDAATEYAESRMACSLMPRTLRAKFESPAKPIDLPRGPVVALIKVTGKGQEPTTDYDIVNFARVLRIVPRGGIRYPVFVDYQAGFIATDGVTPAVPADIKLACLMHAATLYANRESISEKALMPVPHSLDAFYARKSRHVGVG